MPRRRDHNVVARAAPADRMPPAATGQPPSAIRRRAAESAPGPGDCAGPQSIMPPRRVARRLHGARPVHANAAVGHRTPPVPRTDHARSLRTMPSAAGRRRRHGGARRACGRGLLGSGASTAATDRVYQSLQSPVDLSLAGAPRATPCARPARRSTSMRPTVPARTVGKGGTAEASVEDIVAGIKPYKVMTRPSAAIKSRHRPTTRRSRCAASTRRPRLQPGTGLER